MHDLDARTPLQRDTLSRRHRLAHFPLAWMLIGVLAIALEDALLTGIGSALGPVGTALGALSGGVIAVLLYRLIMRRMAGRTVPELAAAGALRQAMTGAAIGAGFVLVSVALVALLGGFTIAWHPIDAFWTIVTTVAVNLGAAVVEELIFRGLAFQAIERLGGGRTRGTVLAVAITAAFFGGAHLLNPGATLWTGFAIAAEAGVLTGAAFLWRRNLWLAIGLHAAWNIVEGLLGIAVSGHRDPGLFLTTAHGPALISGGTFGLEASIVPVVVGLAIAAAMLRRRRD
jgi:hypothetical protein